MKATDERMELRSEKVRKLVGDVPSALVRWGCAIMVIIVLLLLMVLLGAYYFGDFFSSPM